MNRPPPSKDSPIIIVGASVLGLSTALHLASRGYTSVTLLDRRPSPHPFSSSSSHTPATQYAPLHYTSHYHALSLSALTAWTQWNESLWSSTSSSQEDRLWINNGFYTFFTGTHDSPAAASPIPDTALRKITYLERRHGLKLALLASIDPDHVDSATSRMFCIDPFRVLDPSSSQSGGSSGEGGGGVLDTLGGTILVDPAWLFAVAMVKGAAGVRVIFDESAGCVDQVLFSSGGQEGKTTTTAAAAAEEAEEAAVVTGVRTRDGKTHKADFVVWACDPSGGISTKESPLTSWIPQPFPASSPTTTTTTETVFRVRISPDDNPDLWDRLSEDAFPSWTHTLPSITGAVDASGPGREVLLLGFPRDQNGYIQVVHRERGAASTSSSPFPPPFSSAANLSNDPRSSQPVATTTTTTTTQQVVETFLSAYLPDLPSTTNNTTTHTTHSFPDRAVVDRPPSTENLLLAYDPRSPHQTFMFLPVVGNAVVHVLEGAAHPVKGWRWPLATAAAAASSSPRPPFEKGARL